MNTDRPNVLLVTVDQWPAALMGSAGHPCIQTPTLDHLAQAGTRFTNAYSESPVCVPARRSLMTGTTPRSHGDRIFQQDLPMPSTPTIAQTFRSHGYQASAVGKLHVYPQRDRIGFDDVILHEEGRAQWGVSDDYERQLLHAGYGGLAYTHAMGNNQYVARPWHLPESFHPTHWAAKQMAETILRRDPTRPSFWYLSFAAPHPPLTPPQQYLEMYRNTAVETSVTGDWAADFDCLPIHLRNRIHDDAPFGFNQDQVEAAKRAFYAQCTYIDHQLRVVIGTLREQKLLDDTIVAFTADHGDMLGDHGLWAKRVFYERSTNVPMIILDTADSNRLPAGSSDDRLIGLQDVMPSLLDMADIPIPSSVEGRSIMGPRRKYLHGEYGEGADATRMVHDGEFKLIYYPMGNVIQLFDTIRDPRDEQDLSSYPEYSDVISDLTQVIIQNSYGTDSDWISGDVLVGISAKEVTKPLDRGLSQQRGLH